MRDNGSPKQKPQPLFNGRRQKPLRKYGCRQSTPVTAAETLDEPLSKLAARYEDIPVFDIVAYINRGKEERESHLRDKASNSKAEIRRPLNAFMLYRKAYQHLAQHVVGNKQHNVLSRVIGASWQSEDESVKDLFQGYYSINHWNHMLTFPAYKYQPVSKKKFNTPEAIRAEEVEDEIVAWSYDHSAYL
jgi:hypothetical protein